MPRHFPGYARHQSLMCKTFTDWIFKILSVPPSELPFGCRWTPRSAPGLSQFLQEAARPHDMHTAPAETPHRCPTCR